jgi:hypothetical protein
VGARLLTRRRGARGCLRLEHEAFDRDVGVEVVGAHERDHPPAAEFLNAGDQLVAHGLLVPAHLENEVGSTV